MVELTSLWLPIVLSGVALFFASFLSWMVLPHHKQDWVGLPDEAGFDKALGDLNVPAGNYMFPYCGTSEQMKSPEFQTRQKNGPNGLLQVWPGPTNMGMNMACTLLLFLVISFSLAYLATLGPELGDEFMKVFRFVGTAAILIYAGGPLLNGIWFRRKLCGDILDGIAYGLITGAIFAAMWPTGPAL
jgi:hypothetical protein